MLQDEIGVPYLHVLPRLTMRFMQGGLFWNATAENLVSESKKDHYLASSVRLVMLDTIFTVAKLLLFR